MASNSSNNSNSYREVQITFEILGKTLLSFMDFATIGNLFKIKIGVNWSKLYPYDTRLKLYLSINDMQRRLDSFNHKNTSLRVWNIQLLIPKAIHIKHDITKIRKRYQKEKMLKKTILYIIYDSLYNNTKISKTLNDIRYSLPSKCESINIEVVWSSLDSSLKYQTVKRFSNQKFQIQRINNNISMIIINGIKFIGGNNIFNGISKLPKIPKNNSKKKIKKNKNNSKGYQYKFGIYNKNDESINIRDIIFGNKFIDIKTFYGAHIHHINKEFNVCAAVVNTDSNKTKWNIKYKNKYIITETAIVWSSRLI